MGSLEDLFAFLLCHASEDPENLALRLVFLVIGKPVKNFLFGFVADRAGVVKDEAGLFDGRNLAVPLPHQRADHLFGVMHIHLATEGFEVKRLFLRVRHLLQYKADAQGRRN